MYFLLLCELLPDHRNAQVELKESHSSLYIFVLFTL